MKNIRKNNIQSFDIFLKMNEKLEEVDGSAIEGKNFCDITKEEFIKGFPTRLKPFYTDAVLSVIYDYFSDYEMLIDIDDIENNVEVYNSKDEAESEIYDERRPMGGEDFMYDADNDPNVFKADDGKYVYFCC